MKDFITIGSATQDIFIESDLGKILDLKALNGKDSFLCFDYGAKVEIDKLRFDIGGGAINTCINFANLGFNTATIVKMGNDLNSQVILSRLKDNKVDTSLLTQTNEFKTGFSVILNSFEGDRTVLAHRGANSHISKKEIPWNSVKNTKWLYIAPLSGDSNLVLDELAEFARNNSINLALNPGTTQLKRGLDNMKKVLSTAQVLVMNSSEASEITKIPESMQYIDALHKDLDNEDEENPYENIANEPWIISVYKMLFDLKAYGPKLVAITKGSKGVVAFDGNEFYLVPTFPVKVVSTLGAGDAFASTLTASILKYDWDIEKALSLASINSSAIIQSFGAQNGLKSFDELESILDKKKKYKITRKSKKEVEALISSIN